MFKTYIHLQHQTDSDEVNGLHYFTNTSFWNWLFSKEGRIDLYQDMKAQETVYYNNFKLFHLLWKCLLVLFTFRVLVMLFGPTYT